MIKQVYDLMKRVSREHRLIQCFKYDMLSKSAGVGEDLYPLVFLEMPIYFNSVGVQDGTVPTTFNFDIVLNPQALENYDVPQLKDVSCQEIASQVAQQMIAHIRNLYKEGETDVNVQSYSIMTLQRWYDDNSYGVRVTVYGSIKNEIGFCSDDDYFDPSKEFSKDTLLQPIDTDDASGCQELSYKLPNITL